MIILSLMASLLSGFFIGINTNNKLDSSKKLISIEVLRCENKYILNTSCTANKQDTYIRKDSIVALDYFFYRDDRKNEQIGCTLQGVDFDIPTSNNCIILLNLIDNKE